MLLFLSRLFFGGGTVDEVGRTHDLVAGVELVKLDVGDHVAHDLVAGLP